MANRRMLSKSISINEEVASMSLFSQWFFTWMIPHADDWGRMTGSLEQLRAMVAPMNVQLCVAPGSASTVPVTAKMIDAALQEMENAKDAEGVPLIVRYTVGGKKCIQFPQWESHQKNLKLEKRAPSQFPEESREIAENRAIAQKSRKIAPKISEDNLSEEKLSEDNQPAAGAPIIPLPLLCFIETFRPGSAPQKNELEQAKNLTTVDGYDEYQAVAIIKAWHVNCWETWRKTPGNNGFPRFGWFCQKIPDYLAKGTLPGATPKSFDKPDPEEERKAKLRADFDAATEDTRRRNAEAAAARAKAEGVAA